MADSIAPKSRRFHTNPSVAGRPSLKDHLSHFYNAPK